MLAVCGIPQSAIEVQRNRISCPSNQSKQVQATHTSYSTSTNYTQQSLNEKQHTNIYFHINFFVSCDTDLLCLFADGTR